MASTVIRGFPTMSLCTAASLSPNCTVQAVSIATGTKSGDRVVAKPLAVPGVDVQNCQR